MTGQRSALKKLTLLSASFAKLVDAALNVTSIAPDLVVMSKIFNSTTWSSLSNDTLSLIRGSMRIWAHRSIMGGRNTFADRSKLDEIFGASDSFTSLVRICQLLDSTTDLLAGGDVWQKLRVIYESSKVKPVLTLIEDMPNVVVSAVDTFVRSDRLNDFVGMLFSGKAHPCDVDKYLIVPSFVRKKVLLSSVANFCQKFVLADRQLTLIDVLPLDAKYEVTVR